jgi:hypothetical protein
VKVKFLHGNHIHLDSLQLDETIETFKGKVRAIFPNGEVIVKYQNSAGNLVNIVKTRNVREVVKLACESNGDFPLTVISTPLTVISTSPCSHQAGNMWYWVIGCTLVMWIFLSLFYYLSIE